VVVNNSTNINKRNNHLSSQIIANEKEHNIMLEIQVLAWNRHINVAVFNWLVGC
jgi:hypothetical protein